MLWVTTATASQMSRIILVGDRKRKASGQDEPAIRRYRLARLRLNEHDRTRQPGAGRFEHLRRSYD